MHNIDLTVPGNNTWGEQERSALRINNTASKNTCLYCLLSTLSTCVFVLHVFKAECSFSAFHVLVEDLVQISEQR